MLRKDFQVYKTQLWSWPAATNLMKIRGFQKCKVHSLSLRGFRIIACQSWCNPAWPGFVPRTLHRLRILVFTRFWIRILARPDLHQLWQAVILKPLRVEECTLRFWKSLIFINLVAAGQDHSCVLNDWKSFLNIACFRVFMKYFKLF